MRAGALLDLLRGALRAHAAPARRARRRARVGERVRGSVSGVLACWLAFAVAASASTRRPRISPFPAVARAHVALGGAHLTVQVLALLASLAVVLGALPLVVLALDQGRRRPQLRVLLGLPFAAVAVFIALTAALVVIAHAQPKLHGAPAARAAFIAWELAGVICGVVCVLAARRALFAIPLARGWLLYALGAAHARRRGDGRDRARDGALRDHPAARRAAPRGRDDRAAGAREHELRADRAAARDGDRERARAHDHAPRLARAARSGWARRRLLGARACGARRMV